MTKYKLNGDVCYEYPNCKCTNNFVVEKNKKLESKDKVKHKQNKSFIYKLCSINVYH